MELPPNYNGGSGGGGNNRQRRSSIGGSIFSGSGNQQQQQQQFSTMQSQMSSSTSGLFLLGGGGGGNSSINNNGSFVNNNGGSVNPNNYPTANLYGPSGNNNNNNNNGSTNFSRSQSANNSYVSAVPGMGMMASQALSDDRFLCPISGQVMRDPVRTPCGHNFDRKSIQPDANINTDEQDYIESEVSCPVCFSVFPKTQLRSDVQLAQEINRIMASMANMGGTGNSQSQLQLDMRNVNNNGNLSSPSPVSSGTPKGKATSPTSKKSIMGIFQRRKSVAEGPSDQPIEESPSESSNPAPRASSRRGSFLSRFRPKGPYAKIVFLNDPSQGVDFMKEEYVIGRSSQCEIRFKQVEVSGRHCRIFKVESTATASGNPEIQCFMEDYR